MTLVLLLHPGEGLLTMGGLSNDFPLVLTVLGTLGTGTEGVLLVVVVGVNLSTSDLLLEVLDSLTDGGALVMDAWVDLNGDLVVL